MRAGVSPRRSVTELVGYYNRATGKREGGIIGLTDFEKESVDRAFADLRSGDPEGIRRYLRRSLRDKRFDAVAEAALEQGKPVPADLARRMRAGVESKALANRAERISRTELLGSLHAASDEGMQQLVDSGKVPARAITCEWDASEDIATRPTHSEANKQRIQFGQTFSVGGYQMRFPGDRANAPAHECVCCRCKKRYIIDYLELE